MTASRKARMSSSDETSATWQDTRVPGGAVASHSAFVSSISTGDKSQKLVWQPARKREHGRKAQPGGSGYNSRAVRLSLVQRLAFVSHHLEREALYARQ